MDKKRIACFFTGGYTELNALKLFFKKVNDKVTYVQLCPTGTRKSKTQIRARHTDDIILHQSGLTGSALTNYVLDFVKKPRFQEEQYDAILIEDDKDSRFLSVQKDGTACVNIKNWSAHRDAITNAIHSSCPNIPVFFIYAAPEIEAWFIADWENGFGKVYESRFKTQKHNQFFSFAFKRHVEQTILTSRYVNAIESYGYFGGKYRKLSEQIQDALASKDATKFIYGYSSEEKSFIPRYSKRVEGEEMLECIDPDNLMEKCSVFLKAQLLLLKDFV